MNAADKKLVDKKGTEVDVNEELQKLEVDMREIFKLIADYCEIFDNYKEAITQLKTIYESSQLNEVILAARKRR